MADSPTFQSAITPPPSPFDSYGESLPIIPTDDIGMIADDELEHATSRSALAASKRRRPKKHLRHGRTEHVSKHFLVKKPMITTPPATPQNPRVIADLFVDELSSDSSLTDVPSDIGPDPFVVEAGKSLKTRSIKTKYATKSPYFANKPRRNFISCLPFPPLSTPKFGLMQERLAQDPFRLLIATIFLNRTRGEQAMPVFFQLMERYATVADLAAAEVEEVVAIIRRLGFQNQRARKCIEMAKAWLRAAPGKGKRYRKLNYPVKGDGRDVLEDEAIEDEDPRTAWEIAYLPGLGPYSHDSWRIFCRDKLRGLSNSWDGQGAADEFEPEWKRVLPTDKELRAYLTWMWLKEGWLWNKETGERTKAGDELLERARGGGVVQEEQETDHLVLASDTGLDVEKTAGSFLPG